MFENISTHLDQQELDVRKTNNARFMDQKVTPDVLSFIADCIVNYVTDNETKEFCIRDIWDSQYFIKNVQMFFDKPSPEKDTSSSEYDKFIAQPIKTLEYAGILSSNKKGRTTYFQTKNFELLEFISIKDKNAYIFLTIYLRKVLTDSGFIKFFDEFLKKSISGTVSSNDFTFLKDRFEKFIIGNTKINKPTEVRRIFPKILNIFSVENNTFGTIRGHLSKRDIHYIDLMYNRVNFRDIEKSKSLTRQEAIEQKEDTSSYEDYNENLINRAMRFIKKKYPQSEVFDAFSNGPATYVHHIFPKSEYPQIAHYLENLIKLTAEQHYGQAHPKGHTQKINQEYQLICLLSKSKSIEQSLISGEFCYSKNNFVYVINTGLYLDDDKKVSHDSNFNEIRSFLKTFYKTI